MPNYLVIAIFLAVSLFIPISMLLFSRLVRPKSDENEVKTLTYESAEESIGQRVAVMTEYLHYFSLFLTFEIVGVVLIVWVTFARQLSFMNSIYILMLPAFAFVLEVFLLLLNKRKL